MFFFFDNRPTLSRHECHQLGTTFSWRHNEQMLEDECIGFVHLNFRACTCNKSHCCDVARAMQAIADAVENMCAWRYNGNVNRSMRWDARVVDGDKLDECVCVFRTSVPSLLFFFRRDPGCAPRKQMHMHALVCTC